MWLPLTGLDGTFQRSALLLIPAVVWAGLAITRRYSGRELAGSFLAYAWHFQAALVLNIVFARQGLAFFATGGHVFYGVPVEVVAGEAMLVGAVNALLLGHLPFVARLAAAAAGLAAIYLYSWIAALSDLWQLALLFGLAAAPSLTVAEWTGRERHVVGRSVLQSLNWVCLLFWLFPSSIFQNTGHSWQAALERPVWQSVLYLLPMLVPAAVIFSALRQFAVEGNGTAFPYDPPKRLVTGGVYAYISNPMQVGVCIAMAWWGVVTESLAVSASAAVAAILFIVFKDVCNGSCAIGELDPNWTAYQREVPRWIPRITPWRLP